MPTFSAVTSWSSSSVSVGASASYTAVVTPSQYSVAAPTVDVFLPYGLTNASVTINGVAQASITNPISLGTWSSSTKTIVISAIARTPGTHNLSILIRGTGFTNFTDSKPIEILPLPIDLTNINSETRETIDAPCPPNILDINTFKGNSFSFQSSIGNWKLFAGTGTLKSSTASKKYLDLNSLLATSTGGPLTISSDAYELSEDFASRTARAGMWIYASENISIFPYLHVSSSANEEIFTNEHSVAADTWTWVDVYSDSVLSTQTPLNAELRIVTGNCSSGTEIFISAPILTSTDLMADNSLTQEIWFRLPEYLRQADENQTDPDFPLWRFTDALFSVAEQVEFLWDWISYIPPDDGGDGSEYFDSHLVNPRICCPSYLPWLSTLLGINIKNPLSGFTDWSSLSSVPAGASAGTPPEPLSNWTEWQFYDPLDTDNDGVNEWSEIENFNTNPVDSVPYLRWQVENAYFGLHGGTSQAIAEAAKQVLQGNRSVRIIRHTSPQHPDGNPWRILLQTLVSETPDVTTVGASSAAVLEAVDHALPAGFQLVHKSISSLVADAYVLYETADGVPPEESPFGASRVAVIGDSIGKSGASYYGIDGSTFRSLSGRDFMTYVLETLNGKFYYIGNFSKQISSPSDMASRLQSDVLSKSPDIVFLCGGLWGQDLGISVENVKFLIKSMISEIVDSGAIPVIGNCWPSDTSGTKKDFVETLNRWMERYCSANKIELLDYFSIFVDPATGLLLNSTNKWTTLAGKYICAADAATQLADLATPIIKSLISTWSAPLPTTSDIAKNLNKNGTFAYDTNGSGSASAGIVGDGIADYWNFSGVRLNGSALVTTATNNNYASTPNSASLSIVGDIDISCRVSLADWTPTAGASLIGNLDNTVSGYELQVMAAGRLSLVGKVGATNIDARSSVVPPGLTDDQTYWIRVTRNSSTGEVLFYKASDSTSYPTSWTQIGTTITSTVGGFVTPTRPLHIGMRATAGQPLNGKFYRAIIKNGIDGTAVFDADFSTQTAYANTFTETAASATVTINSGIPSIQYPPYQPTGASIVADGLSLPNAWKNYATMRPSTALNITGDIDIRCYATLTKWTSPTGQQNFISRKSTDNSYRFFLGTDSKLSLTWSPDGQNEITVTSSATVSITDNTPYWVRCTLDVDNGSNQYTIKFYKSSDGSNWLQVGSTVNGAGVTSIYSGKSNIEFGSYNWGISGNVPNTFFDGIIHRAQIFKNIDGTLVLDADFAGATVGALSFTEAKGGLVEVKTTQHSIVGNAQRLSIPVMSNNGYAATPQPVLSTDLILPAAGWSVGETIAFCGRFSDDAYDGQASFRLNMIGGTPSQVYVFNQINRRFSNFIFYDEVVIPTGTTSLRFDLLIASTATPNLRANYAEISQLGLWNKTRGAIISI